MHAWLVLTLFSLSSSLWSLVAGQGPMEPLDLCTDEQQRSIYPTLLGCGAREEVVQLDLPNDTFVHVVPNHVMVNRCGGSCHNRYHSCLPSTTRTKKVDVLLIPRTTAAGTVASVCAQADVEEHTTCQCGCATTADMCTPGQRFVQTECRCVCANDQERGACLRRGWYWNPRLCQCMCRNPMTFPPCPSGYQFDAMDSCTCVNYSEMASALVETLVILLACSVLMTVFGVAHCYRTSTGLFRKPASSEDSGSGSDSGQASSVRATELRALFRALSNPGQTSGTPMSWLGYTQIDESGSGGPSPSASSADLVLAAAAAAAAANPAPPPSSSSSRAVTNSRTFVKNSGLNTEPLLKSAQGHDAVSKR